MKPEVNLRLGHDALHFSIRGMESFIYMSSHIDTAGHTKAFDIELDSHGPLVVKSKWSVRRQVRSRPR